MDHMKVLKRAWQILWSYKALWIFGIILALTTSSGNGSGNSGLRFSGNGGSAQGTPFGNLPQDVQGEIQNLISAAGRFFSSVGTTRLAQWAIAGAIALSCLVLLLVVIGVIARLVSRVALMRMVDKLEETGEHVTVGQGFRLGWSRRAWRIFLIDLVVVLPLIVAFTLIFLLAFAPLLFWASRNAVVGIFATVVSIGLIFLGILILIVVAIAVKLLLRFARRACALEDLGVFESIRRGYDVIRAHLKDVGLMWLIMLGVNIAVFVVIIPIVVVVLIAGGLAGGAVLLVVRGMVGLFASVAAAWVVAAVLAILTFLVVMIVPLTFVGGLRQVFQSTTWTLTYREVTALEVPEVEPDALPAAKPEAEEANGTEGAEDA